MSNETTMASVGPIEQFAVLQAIYKELGKALATGDSTNLRGAVENGYREIYELTGATSFDIKLGGEKVGTFSFTKVAATEEQTETVFRVTDSAALWEWIAKDDSELEKDWCQDHAQEFARYTFEKTGVMPDGCKLVDVITPAKPAGIKQGVARINPELVRKHATAAQIANSVMGLLPEYKEEEE